MALQCEWWTEWSEGHLDPTENTAGLIDRFFRGQVFSAAPGGKAAVYNMLY